MLEIKKKDSPYIPQLKQRVLGSYNKYGGPHGIRDKGLLASAVHTPQATFSNQYLYPDIFQMAAAYMYSIIKNHPFIDGNK